MIDATVVIRCRNWDEEPEICHLDCGVLVTPSEAASSEWISIILDTRPEWMILLRSCREHGHHYDPYCSLGCLTRFHSRHEHPTDDIAG